MMEMILPIAVLGMGLLLLVMGFSGITQTRFHLHGGNGSSAGWYGATPGHRTLLLPELPSGIGMPGPHSVKLQ